MNTLYRLFRLHEVKFYHTIAWKVQSDTKKRLSPGVSPLGEPLVYSGRRSRIKIQAFSRGGEWFFSFFPLPMMPAQGVVLENKKGGSQVNPDFPCDGQ